MLIPLRRRSGGFAAYRGTAHQMSTPYEILDRKRSGGRFTAEEIAEAVDGATTGSWSDAQLGAFLMSSATRGLDVAETAALTDLMLRSGEQWRLRDSVPLVGDKHSTGGVGDKVSLVLAPLLAAVGVPVAMLTGRGLGHTGGTADKLEGIPGVDLRLDRAGTLRSLERHGLAIGMATSAIAPADRRLYALRNETGTVRSIPLVVGSILSKKLATGAAAVAFDVKTGSGAFFTDPDEARELAQLLVDTCQRCGVASSALITDMGQPLGEWSGNDQEVAESLATLAGEGPADLTDLTIALAIELGALLGVELTAAQLSDSLASGEPRERFERWAVAVGGDSGWMKKPQFELAERECVVTAARSGVLARVDTMAIGNLLAQAGAGRIRADDRLDRGVSLRRIASVGDTVDCGQELARVYLRDKDESLADRFRDCFEVDDTGQPRALVLGRVTATVG